MIGLQFFEKFNGSVHGFRCCTTAFVSPLFDSAGFVCVEFEIVVVEFDPVIPLHGPQSHGDVIRSVSERSVW